MPLPPPASRRLIHTRDIESWGYQRDDGLWDIEGLLTDRKHYDAPFRDGHRTLKAGDFVHRMWMRLTVDLDFLIHDAVAVTENAPFDLCANAAPDVSQLKGLVIRRGFNKRVNELIGGAKGCTHLREMLGRLANTAYQSTYIARRERDGEGQLERGKSMVGSCMSYASDSPITRERWPALYTGGEPAKP